MNQESETLGQGWKGLHGVEERKVREMRPLWMCNGSGRENGPRFSSDNFQSIGRKLWGIKGAGSCLFWASLS